MSRQARRLGLESVRTGLGQGVSQDETGFLLSRVCVPGPDPLQTGLQAPQKGGVTAAVLHCITLQIASCLSIKGAGL